MISRHGVGTGDEEQFRIGILGADVTQGVDGVGDAGTVDVHARHGEFRVRRGGDDRHKVPVLRIGDLLVQLEHRPSGRHEDHLVEVVHPGHFGGCDQMAVMDRIESAAHDADAQPVVPVASCGPASGGHG